MFQTRSIVIWTKYHSKLSTVLVVNHIRRRSCAGKWTDWRAQKKAEDEEKVFQEEFFLLMYCIGKKSKWSRSIGQTR